MALHHLFANQSGLMGTMWKDSRPTQPPLGLWDVVSIIVGIIIGVGIYKTPKEVFNWAPSPGAALGVWVLGGLLSLAGALCFAELASTYPRSGGEYVYLSRAYGSWMGFLFAWAQLVVIRTGSNIAAMAYVFADYANHLWGLSPLAIFLCAILSIGVLTAINILGAVPGKRTQNLLTVLKVLGLAGIVVVGFTFARTEGSTATVPATSSFAGAMIFVLYSFGGWHEAAYVSAEVRDPRRNVTRALILGTAAVTLIYVLVNAAYLLGLGFDGARNSDAVAAAVLRPLGEAGVRAMSVLVMVSALGSMSGVLFTGARIFSEMGADHRLFAPLGRWSPRFGSPIWSLVIQAALSMGMVVIISLVLKDREGFDTLVKWTAPVFWLFFLLTGLSLFVLRYRDPAAERPFRVPFYPVLPLVFCASCGYMLYGSVRVAGVKALVGGAVLAAGLPLYLLGSPSKARPHSSE